MVGSGWTAVVLQGSDALERAVGWDRRLDIDPVAGADDTPGGDDAHDPGLPDRLPVLVTAGGDLQEPFAEPVDLDAGASQSGDTDDGPGPDVQQRVRREPGQVQALGEDVLAEVTRGQLIALFAGLVEELPGQQVHLAQVRLRRMARPAMKVLDGDTSVRVPLDTDALEQDDLRTGLLAEPVVPVL